MLATLSPCDENASSPIPNVQVAVDSTLESSFKKRDELKGMDPL